MNKIYSEKITIRLIQKDSERVKLFYATYSFLELYQIVAIGNTIDLSFELNEVDNVLTELADERSIFTRYETIIQNFKEDIEISEIKNGSLSITIAGLSLFASIFIPFIIYYLQKNENERIIFEINSEDKEIQEFIEKFQTGYYGRGERNFTWFLEILNKKGYDTKVIDRNTYSINKIADKINRRIIRTIKY